MDSNYVFIEEGNHIKLQIPIDWLYPQIVYFRFWNADHVQCTYAKAIQNCALTSTKSLRKCDFIIVIPNGKHKSIVSDKT